MIRLSSVVELFGNLFVCKYQTLVYVPTPYTLFQYILLRPACLEKTLFFRIASDRRDLPPFFSRLPHCQMLPNCRKNLWFILFLLQRYWVKLLVFVFSKRCDKVYLSGHLNYIEFFIYYVGECIFLEDGVINYNEPNQVEEKRAFASRVWKKIEEILFVPRYLKLGWSDKVKKIYLTGMLPIPEGIAHKVELINIKKRWRECTPAQQDEMCRIFLPEGSGFIAHINKEVLLLTQSFSEDSNSFFSEEEKIEVYRTILTHIDESTVLIKTHPRETTDYKKYFPQAEVLQTTCPMELLELLGLKVKKAITVNSTAIYNLDSSVEKVITGMHVTPRLHEEMMRRFKGEPIVSIKH